MCQKWQQNVRNSLRIKAGNGSQLRTVKYCLNNSDSILVKACKQTSGRLVYSIIHWKAGSISPNTFHLSNTEVAETQHRPRCRG